MKTCIKCGSHAFNLHADGIDQGEFCDVHYWQGRANRAEALAQPERPEQEPVAWRVKVEIKLRDGSVAVGYQLRNEKMSAHDEPLYTTPPQPKSLTDEQRESAFVEADNLMDADYRLPWRMAILKAVEAAHNIK